MTLLVIFNTSLQMLGEHLQSNYDSFNLQTSEHARFHFMYHIYILNLTSCMQSTTEIYQLKSNHMYSSLQLRVVLNCHTVLNSILGWFLDRHAPPFLYVHPIHYLRVFFYLLHYNFHAVLRISQ